VFLLFLVTGFERMGRFRGMPFFRRSGPGHDADGLRWLMMQGVFGPLASGAVVVHAVIDGVPRV